ncbi:MAG: 2,3-bisphosphoglycerate-independent phosphoglycerate mutase [Neisseriaceae bacterium]
MLLILDGFGVGKKETDNAIFKAHMPYWDALTEQFAYGTIEASEERVGLPAGQFGNSEVGHLNMGAGRVVEQDITRIQSSIREDTLKDNTAVKELCSDPDRTVHLLGLFSDGGVHSHIEHFFAILDLLTQHKLKKVVVHPFLDGRDTPPRSARIYLQRLQQYQASHPQIKVGSVSGRFYAMDRDHRWERIRPVYDVLTGGAARYDSPDALEALEQAYARGETDEFLYPTRVDASAYLKDGDAVLFLNFRADRSRQLLTALSDINFSGFPRQRIPKLSDVFTMTDYGDQFHCAVLFPPISLQNGLGEYLSQQGLRQLRIAETEKYPHVTYFFNGGIETPYANENRVLVPSPKVTTYDLKPEMSAYEVTDKVVESVHKGLYEVIICNFANADMVGHTGNLEATITAVETLDKCIGRIAQEVRQRGGELVITADHGNCEKMYDESCAQPHTQHTTNLVPFLYVGEPAEIEKNGALKDVAPTILALLGIDPPPEMTGKNLVRWH